MKTFSDKHTSYENIKWKKKSTLPYNNILKVLYICNENLIEISIFSERKRWKGRGRTNGSSRRGTKEKIYQRRKRKEEN